MANKNGRRDPEKERFWRQTIEQQGKSGQTIREFCEAQGLKSWSFSWWRRELRRRDREERSSKPTLGKQAPKAKDASPFVPVEVVPEKPDSLRSASIEIFLPTGQMVRVSQGVDPRLLAGVLQVLERQPC